MIRRQLDPERQKAFDSGDIFLEELQTVQLIDEEMEILVEVKRCSPAQPEHYALILFFQTSKNFTA
jgi:hypothetical protein